MNTLTQDNESKQAQGMKTVRIPRDIWQELRRESYETERRIEAVLAGVLRQHYRLDEPQSKTA